MAPIEDNVTDLAREKDPRERNSNHRISQSDQEEPHNLATSKDPRTRSNSSSNNGKKKTSSDTREENNKGVKARTMEALTNAPSQDEQRGSQSRQVRRSLPGAWAVAGPNGGDPASEEMDNLGDAEETPHKDKAEYLVDASLVEDFNDDDPFSMHDLTDVELGVPPVVVQAKHMLPCYKIRRCQLLFCVVILLITTGVLVGVLIGTRDTTAPPPPPPQGGGGGGNGGGGNGGGGGNNKSGGNSRDGN